MEALGVKVANPTKPVLSINGDGGVLFTFQELATAVQHGISTVTLVFNDGAYGNVRQGLRARTPEELRRALRQGFEAGGPTLIEVPVGEMPNPWPLLHLPRIRPAVRQDPA